MSSSSIENSVLDVVEDVIMDLSDKMQKYKNDQTLTLEDKAIPLSEIQVALVLLKNVKKSSPTSSIRAKISNCFVNQQLLFSASKVLSYNDELADDIKLLETVKYYQIPELDI